MLQFKRPRSLFMQSRIAPHRRGSTLVIVIALLGLLSFLGIVFFSFASQERASSEYFSNAAKFAIEEPPDVFNHMLRHVIVGPKNTPNERLSILFGGRHSMVPNMYGNDLSPYSGKGVTVVDAGSGVPGSPTHLGNPTDWLDFVDSPFARAHLNTDHGRDNYALRGSETPTPLPVPPEPDVDYTAPDINNLFLAYKGTAIREDGAGGIEQVPVIIPSFLRPQYMKTSVGNHSSGNSVPTDPDWITAFDGTFRNSAKFSARSFRPNPRHLAGRLSNGTEIFRYVTAGEAAGLGLVGGFPFIPLTDDQSAPFDPNSGAADNGPRGELGVWTGSNPNVYELDVDNDGDGIRDGIWLDLHFPVQETSTGQMYVVLHSVTIYDLDSLINLNVHGNLAGIDRLGNVTNAGPGLVRDGTIRDQFLSRSNQGLGPNEINPQWALRRGVRDPGTGQFITPINDADQYTGSYARTPSQDLEQANMEWLWLLAGRGNYNGAALEDILPGRWGEAEKVYRGFHQTKLVADLPRPGASGDSSQTTSVGVRFGGNYGATLSRQGYDDNADAMEGEYSLVDGRIWPFGHPMDYSGAGRTNGVFSNAFTNGQFAMSAGHPLRSLLHHNTMSTGPERWFQYYGYSVNRLMPTANPRYIFGQNETHDFGGTASDDLNLDPIYDPLLEDPLETIFDPEFAQGKADQIFSPADMAALHLRVTPTDSISERLTDLAPIAFGDETTITLSGNTFTVPNIGDKFTTLSNSLRRFPMSHDLGPDMRLGTADDGPRAWEHSADTDGADRVDTAGNQTPDGYPDGDNPNQTGEFPPKFGNTDSTGLPYSATDPFRPQVRRLLTHEVGDTRNSFGQLPISLNHILDVERNAQTPDELAQPIQFLRYMQRAGLRFRPLTEHPSALEGNVLTVTTIPTYDPATPVVFPPVTPEQREYWARRDRQKLCRDIFVLLYTTGGVQRTGTNIRDYRIANIPDDAEGTALYTHRQLREMAQFAVNLVDAMDADNVITKFEYDKNLGNGWNVDDDPYTVDSPEFPEPASSATTAEIDLYNQQTGDGRFREDGASRGIVYGVEAQQVAFGEVLAVGKPGPITIADHIATLYDDSAGRNHLYVELQNMQPTPVTLSTTESDDMDSAVWRIVRYDRKSTSAPATTPTTPLGGIGAQGRPFRAMGFRYAAAINQTIDGGDRYVIGTASDDTIASSDLFVDYDTDNTFELIAPVDPVGTLPTTTTVITDPAEASLQPRCDLDLIHDIHVNGFVMDNESGAATTTKGDFLTSVADYVGNTPMNDLHAGDFNGVSMGFDLVLQRRANPNLPSVDRGPVASRIAGEDPNPWIDVDYVRVEFKDLQIQDMDTAVELQNDRLPLISSDERAEPLDDSTRLAFASASTPAGFRYNTIGVPNNSAPSNGFQLWQPHFDRDFASPGEILNVPLFPQMHLTQMLDRARYSPYHQAFEDPRSPAGDPDPELLAGSAAKFLEPNFPNDTMNAVAEEARDNSWFRLFRFVEVPSRVHRMLGNYVSLDRVPGKLNLNTLRHWEVYAGLIDNAGVLDREVLATNQRVTIDRTLNEGNNPVNRDRWLEYLRSRDGQIATYNGTASVNMIVPGTLNARPFRSAGHFDQSSPESGIQSTILRQNPDDVGNGNPEWNRQLLEIGSRVQHQDSVISTTENTLPNTVQQHQLLSKILNNTTTVSNTFIVFSTAAYFEAVESPAGSGMIRVGSRIDLNTADGLAPFSGEGWQQRAVFIIDRTDAARAFDAGTGSIDWNRLVKARITVE